MNDMKTKVITFERKHSMTDLNITIEDERIKQVSKFVCLSSMFTRKGMPNILIIYSSV